MRLHNGVSKPIGDTRDATSDFVQSGGYVRFVGVHVPRLHGGYVQIWVLQQSRK